MEQREGDNLDKHELIQVIKTNSKVGCWDAND